MRIGLAAALVCLLSASPGFAANEANRTNKNGRADGASKLAKAQKKGDHAKLDRKLNTRAKSGSTGTSRVIIILKPGWDASASVRVLGGRLGRRLGSINGLVVELSNQRLEKLADHPGIHSIHWDRPIGGSLNRAAVTIGARAVQREFGYDGSGVGVAVIDSGITSWHDDLTYEGTSRFVRTAANQRVAQFVDFVNGRLSPYDDNGHGTHVSGIIAGNGRDSNGVHKGIAPGAHIVSLKVLDGRGRGVISDVIAAIDWSIANRERHNIRVINLSVGAAVTESYTTDPLTLAAKRAVDAGIVLVTAAGNLGRNAAGATQYGAITAPGNAPWVLTVGASSHEGTVSRHDDVVGAYSSRGPTAVDYAAKPDLVAPGTGMVSLSDPTSAMYLSKAGSLVKGTLSVGYKPYLSLTGTSMASPVVAGSVVLMLEANPALTPNMVKAILQYTAQSNRGYNALTQGAGFINTKGAVDLARYFASARPGQRYPHSKLWSRTVNWGNRRIRGGVLKPKANAWRVGVVWGAAANEDGDNIVWGTRCGEDCDNIVWGTAEDEDNIVWGTASGDDDNIVWGTSRDDGDNIVWGTARAEDSDNIVWGTACRSEDCDNIVWGTASGDDDNIVWGTAFDDGDNIVWGTAATALNVLWNTAGETSNVVWGSSSAEDDITWGNSAEETPLFDDPDGEPVTFDDAIFDDLFGPSDIVTPVVTPVVETAAATTTSTIGSLLGGGGF